MCYNLFGANLNSVKISSKNRQKKEEREQRYVLKKFKEDAKIGTSMCASMIRQFNETVFFKNCSEFC